MPTIIEHDVSHDSGTASALIGIVAIVAILFVVGIALYAMHIYPFNTAQAAPGINGSIPAASAGLTY